MKVLQVCFRVPIPQTDGGAIAMYNMSKGFVENGVDLSIFSYNTTKHYCDLAEVQDEVFTTERTQTAFVDNNLKPIDAFKNLFSSESYHVSRFFSKEIEQNIRETYRNESFDIIHFEGLFTAPYLKVFKEVCPKAKTVLRQHNIEYHIWKRLAEEASGPKKWYLSLLANRLKNYEFEMTKQFDAVVPITGIDAQYLPNLGVKKYFVSSTGVVLENYQSDKKENPCQVGFLGSLDWMPNQEGVNWLIQKVWPIVREALPQAELKVAGKNPVQEILSLTDQTKGIEVVGEVESAVDYLAEQSLIVIPLMSGSGMRIKAIEAMSAQKAIVSTSVGMEGIPVTDQCVLADTPEEFAKGIIDLLKSEAKKEQMSQKAYSFVKENYSNKSKVKELLGYYEDLLGGEDKEKFKLRFFFDPGAGGCLWSENDKAYKKFGYGPLECASIENGELIEAPITLPCNLGEMSEILDQMFYESLDQTYPPNPRVWSPEKRESFIKNSEGLFKEIVEFLGDDFEIENQINYDDL